jgi:hypothetical protein
VWKSCANIQLHRDRLSLDDKHAQVAKTEAAHIFFVPGCSSMSVTPDEPSSPQSEQHAPGRAAVAGTAPSPSDAEHGKDAEPKGAKASCKDANANSSMQTSCAGRNFHVTQSDKVHMHPDAASDFGQDESNGLETAGSETLCASHGPSDSLQSEAAGRNTRRFEGFQTGTGKPVVVPPEALRMADRLLQPSE